MPSHAVSAKSQTLENKAYHVMSYHDMPAIGGQVGDEGLEPTRVSHSKQRVLRITGIPAGPKAGPNLYLGELTCRPIYRWDELDDGVKGEIAELLSLDYPPCPASRRIRDKSQRPHRIRV